MSGEVAFAPKAAFRDPDCLGTIYVSDLRDFNVRQAVVEGGQRDGTFVVSDPSVVAALDSYEPLKRVSVPGRAPEPAEQQQDPLDALSKKDLLELTEAQQIPSANSMKTDELRSAVRQRRSQGGDS